MKPSFLFAAFLLVSSLFFSCSRDDYQINNNEDDNLATAILTRSREESSVHTEFGVSKRMAERYILSDKTNPRISQIDSYVVDDCICFYVFNFEKGFKIVSADTRVPPILAESSEENLYLDDIHEGVRVWLEDTGDIIRQVKKNNIDTKEDYSSFWATFMPEPEEIPQTRSWPTNPDSVWVKTIDYSSVISSFTAHVPHLLQTKWGQGYPWNVNMPMLYGEHCATCCVVVAISQILYYYYTIYLVPNDFWHSISIASFNSDFTVTLNKSNYTVNSSRWYFMPPVGMTGYHQYVSDLMLDLGERLQVHYGVSASYVNHNLDGSIPNLSLCGLSSSHDAYSFSTVEADLTNGNPVIISAWTQNNSAGHTWVIDGCDDYVLKNTTTETFTYVAVEDLEDDPLSICYTNSQMLLMYPNAFNGMQIVTITYEPVQRLRMNWGYDGQGDDAYYGILDTSDWVYGNVNYNYSRLIHYNLSASQIN